MFKIPGHEQFTTTIGKLNFFRWALESKILDYIEAHEEEIRTGYNTYLKETTQTQKRVKSETQSSTDSNVTTSTIMSDLTQTTQSSLNSLSMICIATSLWLVMVQVTKSVTKNTNSG